MVLNCIIVDDDITSQAVLKAFIEKNDRLNLVEVAGNGKQALNLANKYDLDLVFLDVSMPIMNGFEFLDHLERHTDLKVILVTSEREYALKAFEYNISDYLLKPISKHRFRQAIDWIIQSASIDEGYTRISKRDLRILELIQVMISSNTDVIHPEPSAESQIGYRYPLIEDKISFPSQSNMLRILESAESEGILSGSVMDVVHLCPHCSNHTFSIEESCPDCGSLYQGKGIPNNSAKISSKFNCGDCSAEFLKPVLKVKCGNCQNMHEIDRLERKVIYRYKLTEVGEKLAEGNLYFKDEQLQGETTLTRNKG